MTKKEEISKNLIDWILKFRIENPNAFQITEGLIEEIAEYTARGTGRTTRIVDEAIQKLFKEKTEVSIEELTEKTSMRKEHYIREALRLFLSSGKIEKAEDGKFILKK